LKHGKLVLKIKIKIKNKALELKGQVSEQTHVSPLPPPTQKKLPHMTRLHTLSFQYLNPTKMEIKNDLHMLKRDWTTRSSNLINYSRLNTQHKWRDPWNTLENTSHMHL
jgi:hypothetical protein